MCTHKLRQNGFLCAQIFIDINGSRDIASLWPLVDKYEKVMRPQLIILKSVKIRMLLRQSIAFDENDATIPTLASDQPSLEDSESGMHKASQRSPGEAGLEDAPEACPVCGHTAPQISSSSKIIGVLNSAMWTACIGLGILYATRRCGVLRSS